MQYVGDCGGGRALGVVAAACESFEATGSIYENYARVAAMALRGFSGA